MDQWHVAIDGRQEGPWTTEEVIRRIRAGQIPRTAHVFKPGLAAWEPVTARAELAGAFTAAVAPPPPPRGATGAAHEIDYEIFGEEMQFVEITLDPQEACIAEAGSFMYMDPGIQMETTSSSSAA